VKRGIYLTGGGSLVGAALNVAMAYGRTASLVDAVIHGGGEYAFLLPGCLLAGEGAGVRGFLFPALLPLTDGGTPVAHRVAAYLPAVGGVVVNERFGIDAVCPAQTIRPDIFKRRRRESYIILSCIIFIFKFIYSYTLHFAGIPPVICGGVPGVLRGYPRILQGCLVYDVIAVRHAVYLAPEGEDEALFFKVTDGPACGINMAAAPIREERKAADVTARVSLRELVNDGVHYQLVPGKAEPCPHPALNREEVIVVYPCHYFCG
jgi:hypothetical protein